MDLYARLKDDGEDEAGQGSLLSPRQGRCVLSTALWQIDIQDASFSAVAFTLHILISCMKNRQIETVRPKISSLADRSHTF
jgi:hypothetical protein